MELRRDVVVILNGISRHKKLFYRQYVPALQNVSDLRIFETTSPGDAELIASKMADQATEIILAAGGDGTINQVVNGVLSGRKPHLPVVGLIPLGTGNDFARTVGLRRDVEQLTKLIQSWNVRPVDVGGIEYTPLADKGPAPGLRYFINVADIGMGPVVVERVNRGSEIFGREMAYYLSIIRTFMTYRPVRIEASTSEWSWRGKLRSLAVANGRCYGQGLIIAPDADTGDGIFSVFICGDVSVLDFIRQTPALKKGKYVRMQEVQYKHATAIDLKSETACKIEADGELVGLLPARVRVLDRQLAMLIP